MQLSLPLDELKQELFQAISEWNSFLQQQTEGEKAEKNLSH